MMKSYLSKSGGAKRRNHYKGSANDSNSGIPAHTPGHFKKFSLKGIKGS